MINCDIDNLTGLSACFRCIPPGTRTSVMTYLMCQWANIPTTPAVVYRSSFTNNPTGAGLRNDVSGTVGFSFQVLLPTTVTRLGRKYVAGNVQNHPAGLWITASTTLIASGTILVASPLESTFRWVDVTPVVLSPGINYTIACQEFSGFDTFKDAWNASLFLDTAYVDNASTIPKYDLGGVFVMPANAIGGPGMYNTAAFWHSYT